MPTLPAAVRDVVKRASGLTAYTLASAVALGVDYAVYWLLATRAGASVGVAAPAGYAVGLVIAYVLMSRSVFAGGWLSRNRRYESLLFGVSGLFGIAVTSASAGLYAHLVDGSVHGAKLFAVMTSFFSVYAFRKLFIFRSDAPFRRRAAARQQAQG